MYQRPFDSTSSIPDPREELVRVMYSQIPVIAAGNLSLMTANVMAYGDKLSSMVLALFASSVISLTLVRVGMFGFYRQSRFRLFSALRHSWILSLFSAVNGLIWTGWGVYVVSHLPHPDTLIMLVIQAGICAGTVSTSSASRVGLALFVVPVLLSLVFLEAAAKTRDGDVLAIVIFLYLLLILSSSQRIYKTLRDSIVLAQKNRMLADELYRHSNTDGLTGIANRRFFDNSFPVSWIRAQQHGTPLSVLLVDVDFFKLYNDSKGHLDGDECLRRIALSLQGFFNDEQVCVARYGGEEFVVVLPVNLSQAFELAEAFRQQILDAAIPHERAAPMGVVTVSIGVASAGVGTQDEPVNLLDAADRALYRAKHSGRNRVCYEHSETASPHRSVRQGTSDEADWSSQL